MANVIMFYLRHLWAAVAIAAFFFPVRAAEPAADQFARVKAVDAGSRVEVDVDLASSPDFRVDADGRVLYPMAFNNVAEGWSWQPQADPAAEDYYRYKFLPLQTVVEDRGAYDGEDKVGTPQRMQVTWRYDYFLAFDNLYDFYPRVVDDDAGFAAVVPAAAAGRVAMRAVARLKAPLTSESTTFWKATHGKPVDFTLKKRYLVGTLEEIRFVDRESGEILATLTPAQR